MKDSEYRQSGISRRDFLRRYGIASSALTLSPFFLERMTAVCQAASALTRVYKVKNGDCFQNTAKLWQMLDGAAKYINPSDVVVIKGNAQWPNQGYTHTGCIKGIIDSILQIPGFSGEVLICDNTQGGGLGTGTFGFDATSGNRVNNWSTYNWTELAANYQSQGKPVAVVRWQNHVNWRNPTMPLPSFSVWNPANGPGWTRYFLSISSRPTYLSYPIFASPLTKGRLIDLKNGVWENGSFTGRNVKVIAMPTLNNHGTGSEDYAGVTSAIKSFYGATEIFHGSPNYISDDYVWNGYYSIHSSSFSQTQDPSAAQIAGQLVGTYISTLCAPVLYVTAAMYAGWQSRTSTTGAAATNTVLACTNPVSLDYISCRDVISPYASWLNPDLTNHTRQQLLGCSSLGVGTLDPQKIEVITFDFNHPTATRLDIERKIRDFKLGLATEQDVKDVIRLYMDGG